MPLQDPSRDGVPPLVFAPADARPGEWRTVCRRVQRRQRLRVGAAGLAMAAVVVPVAGLAPDRTAGKDTVASANGPIAGVEVFQDLARDHLPGDLDYPTVPPAGGAHNHVWAACGAYPQQVADEYAVHTMEHGAVWITYRADLPPAQVRALHAAFAGLDGGYLLMTPHQGQDQPIVLTAWQRQLHVQDAADERIDLFVRTYQNGPQTPEKGADCANGLSGEAAARTCAT